MMMKSTSGYIVGMSLLWFDRHRRQEGRSYQASWNELLGLEVSELFRIVGPQAGKGEVRTRKNWEVAFVSQLEYVGSLLCTRIEII
jgi:hypothetical protein